MLSTDFANIAVRDEAVSGLSTLFDADAMCAALASTGTGWQPDSARLHYLRYKPNQNCLALYDFHLNGRIVPVHAKAYGANTAVKLDKARLRPACNIGNGSGRAVLASEGIEVAAFPHDSKLRTLQLLIDSSSTTRLLQRVLREEPDFWHAELTPLAYKPERRYVAQVSADYRQAVVKCYTQRGFERARHGADIKVAGDGFRKAKNLGRSKSKHALAFEFCPGQSLRELTEKGDAISLLAPLGAALASMHAVDVSVQIPSQTVSAESHRLKAIVNELEWLLPEERLRLRELAAHLDDWLKNELTPDSFIHGDFYDKQILVDDDKFVFLDFDAAQIGDPRIDLATFIAHLMCAGFEDWEACAYELISGYQDNSSDREATGKLLKTLPQATALAALYISHHPFRRADAHWRFKIIELLNLVERLLVGYYDSLEGKS